MRKAFWLIVAVLMVTGCEAKAQTVADHRAALKSFLDSQPDSAVPQLESAWTQYGYVAPTTPPPPVSDRRIIFATTLESGPGRNRGYGDFDAHEREDFHSGTGYGQVLQLSNAHSGNWALKLGLNGGQTSGARVFCQYDWSSGTRKPMPLETFITCYVYMPQRYTVSWFMVLGTKQNNAARTYIEPACAVEFGNGPMTYLRGTIKGSDPTPAFPGSQPKILYVTQNKTQFPIAKWVKLEVHVKHDTKNGIFEVKQDGVQLWDYRGRTMRENAPEVSTEFTCYSPNLVAYDYFDDVQIEALK